MTPSTPRSANGRRGDLFDPQCPTRRLLDRIGTKWTSMAVKVLAEASPDEVRFAELQRRMAGVSQKMLSVTLQSLTRDGLVDRRVEATVPPRVHYRLTPLGARPPTGRPPPSAGTDPAVCRLPGRRHRAGRPRGGRS